MLAAAIASASGNAVIHSMGSCDNCQAGEGAFGQYGAECRQFQTRNGQILFTNQCTSCNALNNYECSHLNNRYIDLTADEDADGDDIRLFRAMESPSPSPLAEHVDSSDEDDAEAAINGQGV